MTKVTDNMVRIVIVGTMGVMAIYAMISNNELAGQIIPMITGGFLAMVGYEFAKAPSA